MKAIKLTFILVGALLLWSCSSSLKVTSDYNGELDFSKYKTYNYYRPHPDSVQSISNSPVIANQLNQRRIEKAINEEMYVRGYEISDNPDIWISFYIKVEDKTDITATSYGSPYYRGYGYHGYYGGYGYGGYTDISTYNYKYGTLIIDLVDAGDNELIWYGTASKALDGNNRNPEATINYIVTKMFYQYRFMAGKSEQVRSFNSKK